SVVNFIAAYGTHPLILAANTLEDKRDAAMALMGMGPATESEAAILANASFEGDSLATGAPGVLSDADGNYTLSAPADWTLTGGTGGVFAPAASIVDPAGLTGSNVAWLRQNATLAQDTGLTLEEGAIYRLSL